MATGLPCITTAHGGIPEAVTHMKSMKSGILVGAKDRGKSSLRSNRPRHELFL
jgi:hypothetical protein